MHKLNYINNVFDQTTNIFEQRPLSLVAFEVYILIKFNWTIVVCICNVQLSCFILLSKLCTLLTIYFDIFIKITAKSTCSYVCFIFIMFSSSAIWFKRIQ